VAGVESAGARQSPAKTELVADREVTSVFLATKVLLVEGHVTQEHEIPVHVVDQLDQLIGRSARRVGPCDQSPHARPRHGIDRNSVFLQPLQDADVREPPRASPTEREPDTRTCLRRGGRCVGEDRHYEKAGDPHDVATHRGTLPLSRAGV
jgi:hypothetical protein